MPIINVVLFAPDYLQREVITMCINHYFNDNELQLLKSLQLYKENLLSDVNNGYSDYHAQTAIRVINADIKAIQANRLTGMIIIYCLPDLMLSRLLTMRYIKGYDWITISDKLQYSDRNIYRLHDKALQMFDNTEKMLTA